MVFTVDKLCPIPHTSPVLSYSHMLSGTVPFCLHWPSVHFSHFEGCVNLSHYLSSVFIYGIHSYVIISHISSIVFFHKLNCKVLTAPPLVGNQPGPMNIDHDGEESDSNDGLHSAAEILGIISKVL